MKFENETQFANEAAKEIIRVHLNWSNSLDGTPSDGGHEVFGKMFYAYMDATHGRNWDDEITVEEHDAARSDVREMYAKACKAADAKWEAMLAVMDI